VQIYDVTLLQLLPFKDANFYYYTTLEAHFRNLTRTSGLSGKR